MGGREQKENTPEKLLQNVLDLHLHPEAKLNR